MTGFAGKGTGIKLRKPGITSLPCHRIGPGQVNDGTVKWVVSGYCGYLVCGYQSLPV